MMSRRLGGSWEQKPGLWGGLVLTLARQLPVTRLWAPRWLLQPLHSNWLGFCEYFFPPICVEKYLTFSL